VLFCMLIVKPQFAATSKGCFLRYFYVFIFILKPRGVVDI
jgi:hypothetical protein